MNDESIKNDNMNNATDNTNDKGMIEEAGDKVQDGIDRAEDNLDDAVNRNESATTKNQ